MDQGPLVIEQTEAGLRFLRAFHQVFPVQVAFWLKEKDESSWHLYVASDQITDENFDDGYEEVLRLAEEFQDPWFDPFQVKVIGTDDPLAKAALDFCQRYPLTRVTRYPGDTFGGLGVDGVFLYPSPIPSSSSCTT